MKTNKGTAAEARKMIKAKMQRMLKAYPNGCGREVLNHLIAWLSSQQKRFDLRKGGLGKLAIALLSVSLLIGCQGTKAQRALYTATDAFGTITDQATAQFENYEVAKAMQALGVGATREQITAWVHNDPAWKTYAPMKDNYNRAFLSWCEVNAMAATGTNVVSAVTASQFRTTAMQAAARLTAFIVNFVPTIQTVNVKNF